MLISTMESIVHVVIAILEWYIIYKIQNFSLYAYEMPHKHYSLELKWNCKCIFI